MSVIFSMAYRSSWKFWQAWTPATIRRPLKPRLPVSRIAPAVQPATRSGPSVLGTAGAAAGGMVVGNAISGAIAASQLEDALSQVSADLDANLSEASKELASLSDDTFDLDDVGDDDTDFDIKI